MAGRLIRMAMLSALLAALSLDAAGASSLGQGRVLVQRNCGMCHATGRGGASPQPPALPFRDLHKRYDIDDLGEALAEGILTGHPAMPEFRFTPDEVTSILRYLKSIQTRQTVRGEARPPAG